LQINFPSPTNAQHRSVPPLKVTFRIVTREGMRIRLAFQGIDLYADDPDHCSSNYIEIIDETLKKSQARFCGKKIPNDMVSAGEFACFVLVRLL